MIWLKRCVCSALAICTAGGVDCDMELAVEWWLKAAGLGNAYADDCLGYCYSTGQGGLPKDAEQAFAHYMKAAGLKNVSCRMNDRVTFLEPEQPDYRELLDSVIKADHWSDEKTDREIQEDIGYFMNHGMSRKEAEDYCRQMNGIVRYLKQHADSVSLTQTRGIMISYGWK